MSYQFARGYRMVIPHLGKVKRFVNEQFVGEDIINFWKKNLTFLSLGQVEDAVNAGRVTVNGDPVSPDYRLAQPDTVEYVFHQHEPPVLDLPIQLLYVDSDIIVVNKPPSIPVHPVGSYNKNTVVKILQEELTMDSSELHLAHRLDRAVSGVLLFTRNKMTARLFRTLFAENLIRKEYVALVKGHFPNGTVRVTQPIAQVSDNPLRLGIHPSGKMAVTEFERLALLGEESVVACRPETGRTHQIRLHLQWLGYPIVDDPKHGGLQQTTLNYDDPPEPSDYPCLSWCVECQQGCRKHTHIYNSKEWTESISLHSHSYHSTSPAWRWPPFTSPLPSWAEP